MISNQPSLAGKAAAIWGIAGFFFLMVNAIIRLAEVSLEALGHSLTVFQWLLLLINIIFMAYSEGYKGFQKSFSPRLAARAKYLTTSRSIKEMILAPLFCMNFFNAPRARIIMSFALLAMIITLITLFRMLPQPWRGILDAGVVIGLVWGSASTAWYCIKAFLDPDFDVDPELAKPVS